MHTFIEEAVLSFDKSRSAKLLNGKYAVTFLSSTNSKIAPFLFIAITFALTISLILS
ncbi:Uncharacterised protein [Chlamydia abortus]|nr:Uncharacterised protein [Chlamydia abortus]SGA31990.1 Uncharacterised protein [Chlamydia abortus]SGA32000.1 Uncharacterised protein [Chlamydia abortus]SGA32387.1 Uncharacterised protein [Chlamydia abortus]